MDHNGLTPLHYAAGNGKVEIVKLLLLKGADTTMKDKKGNTVVDYAKQFRKTDVVEVIEKFKGQKKLI